MSKVTGKVKHNRPYFFTNVDGSRAEFAANEVGSADLDGAELAKFEALVKVGAIALTKEEVKESQANYVAPVAVTEPETDLRAEYKALSGKEADGRWKDERVAEEIKKLRDTAGNDE